MPQGTPQLRDIAARKELLIVESEINRLLLKEDGKALARELHDLGGRAAQIRGLVAVGLAAVSALRPEKAAPSDGKRSWFEPIVNTVRLGRSLWTTLRNGKGRD